MEPNLTTPVAAGIALAALWGAEAIFPMFARRDSHRRAANLAVGGVNALVSVALLAAVTYWAAGLTREHGLGLLNGLDLHPILGALIAFVLLDLWHYSFHVAAHKTPLLWRFHATHHHDHEVDTTTALRFHVGELAIFTLCTVPVIAGLGLDLWHIVLYESVLMPVSLFHHANIRLPNHLDRALRLVIVTPRMHWVHHSSWQPETDSNFSSVLSWWDRLFGTYRRRRHAERIHFGLEGFEEQDTDTLRGMLVAPFGPSRSEYGTRPDDPDLEDEELGEAELQDADRPEAPWWTARDPDPGTPPARASRRRLGVARPAIRHPAPGLPVAALIFQDGARDDARAPQDGPWRAREHPALQQREVQMKHRNEAAMKRCAEICHECLDACLRTIPHCLELGGEHASLEHQTLLMDCAAICATSHGLLHRGSPQHVHTCRACAEICRKCAEDCERMGSDDQVMEECARACRECAISCERMSGAAA